MLEGLEGGEVDLDDGEAGEVTAGVAETGRPGRRGGRGRIRPGRQRRGGKHRIDDGEIEDCWVGPDSRSLRPGWYLRGSGGLPAMTTAPPPSGSPHFQVLRI